MIFGAKRRPIDAMSADPSLRSSSLSAPMALSSMTGFARSHGTSGQYAFVWEIKSVNAKGLDLRLRVPPGWDAIEQPVRAKAAEMLARGTVYATLAIERPAVQPIVRINDQVLAAVLATLAAIAALGTAAVMGGGAAVFAYGSSCDLSSLRSTRIGQNSFVYAANGALLGVIPDGARVDEEDVGQRRVVGRLVALPSQRSRDELGIGHVHLAAVGLEVQARHQSITTSSRGVPSQRSLSR